MGRKNSITNDIDAILNDTSFEYLYADSQMLHEIQEMMKSVGWTKWFYPMFDQIIKNLDSIDDIASLRELEARKATKKALMHLNNSLMALIDKGSQANVQLEQIEKSAKDSDLY